MAVADGLMVARGDLGVEIGAAEVPLLQKRIIQLGREAGKPVITATQMLESMVEQPEPTRAEASDVANAILDGTAAVMLSGETAVGEYPIEAVETMVQIALAVEPSSTTTTRASALGLSPRYVSDVVGHAACDMAEMLGAAAIVVPTVTGETAREVSKHRPRRPIVACTPFDGVQRQLMLDWAVVPLALEAARRRGRCGGAAWRRSSAPASPGGRPRRDHERHERQPPGRHEHDPRADALEPPAGLRASERERQLAGDGCSPACAPGRSAPCAATRSSGAAWSAFACARGVEPRRPRWAAGAASAACASR